MPARPRHLTLNAGKATPSPLVMKLIARGVALGAFPWPETNWTKFLRELEQKALTADAQRALAAQGNEPSTDTPSLIDTEQPA